MTPQTRTAATTALILAIIAATAAADTVSWPFHGCEATDVAALAAQDPAGWSGKDHAMGPFGLRHAASLDCTGGDCRALLTMTADHDGTPLSAEPVPAALILGAAEPPLGHFISLDGAAAAALRANLGPAAFVQDGAVKRVMMDYGTLADAVSIRIRTEVGCSPDTDRCTIQADPIAYIPYDDRNRCGGIAVSLAPTN
jgi:hypothetical protein